MPCAFRFSFPEWATGLEELRTRLTLADGRVVELSPSLRVETKREWNAWHTLSPGSWQLTAEGSGGLSAALKFDVELSQQGYRFEISLE